MKKARLRFSLWVMLMLLIFAFTACQDSDDDNDDHDNGDTTAPTVSSGIINVSDVTNNSLILNWSAASDDVTPQSDLQYRVYRSNENNIDTLSNVEANGTAVGDFTADMLTKFVGDIDDLETYYFNVIVKDEAGNKAVYTMKSQTIDFSAPLPGNSGILTIINTDTSTDSLTVIWTKASDYGTDDTELQYMVCNSTSDTLSDVTTIEAAVANSTANCFDYTTYDSTTDDTISKTFTGLGTTTSYYFNIVVQDEDEKKMTYTATSVATGLDGTEDVSDTDLGVSKQINYTSVGVFSNDNALIAYKYTFDSTGQFLIRDASGNLIKEATPFSGVNDIMYTSVTILSNDTALLAYEDITDGNGKFKIFDSSGGDLSNDSVFNSSGSTGYISAITLTGGEVLIAYQDDDSSGDFIIYNSTADNSDDERTFNTSVTKYISATPLFNGNAFIAYNNGDTSGDFVIYDSSSDSIEYSDTFASGTITYISTCTLANGNVLIAYKDEDGMHDYGKFMIYDSSGNVVKTEEDFHQDVTNFIATASLSNGDILISYQDKGHNSYGKYIVYNSSGITSVKPETLFGEHTNTTHIAAKAFSNNKVIIPFNRTNLGSNDSYFVIIR